MNLLKKGDHMAKQKTLQIGEAFVKKCSKKRIKHKQKINLLPTQFVTLKCKKGKPRTVQVANSAAVIDVGTITVHNHKKVKVTAIPGI
jgi:gluconate kinase